MSDAPNRFATTRWSTVLAAGRGGEPEARPALEELCRTYWYPLYAFARRHGRSGEDATDRVQGFFAHLLERDAFAIADPSRGRFRNFLLTSFRHYLANEAEREGAAKRGGGRIALPLDGPGPDGAEAFAPAHGDTAERLFFRDWTVTLLARVLAEVGEEYAAKGRSELFLALRPALARRTVAAAEVAERLGMSPGAVRVALTRLRAKYREALRRTIADTVAGPAELEDEIRDLFASLAAKKR
jgi:RNA polymerase sigma-70 factor (ECF subfamily)